METYLKCVCLFYLLCICRNPELTKTKISSAYLNIIFTIFLNNFSISFNCSIFFTYSKLNECQKILLINPISFHLSCTLFLKCNVYINFTLYELCKSFTIISYNCSFLLSVYMGSMLETVYLFPQCTPYQTTITVKK